MSAEENRRPPDIVLKKQVVPFVKIPRILFEELGKTVTPYGILVYGAIMGYANYNTGECFVLISTIANNLGIGQSTVRREITRLHDLGLITKNYREGMSLKIWINEPEDVPLISGTPPQSSGTPLCGSGTPLCGSGEVAIPWLHKEISSKEISLNEISPKDTNTNLSLFKEEKEYTNHKSTKKPTKEKESFPALPPWVPVEAWEGFLEMRRKKKIPMTARAFRGCVKALEEFSGKDTGIAEKILDASTMNGWSGLYALNGGARTFNKPEPAKRLSMQEEQRIREEEFKKTADVREKRWAEILRRAETI